jgi:hypothetical protein
MHSPLDLRPEDFAWARFSSVLLAGPKVKLGDFVSLDVFSSRLVQVTLAEDSGGYTLDAVETTAMKLKTTELSSLKPSLGTDVRKVVEDYDKKWTKPQVEARILELSTSHALVMPLFDAAPRPRTTEPLPRPKPVTDSKFASWFVEGFFAVRRGFLRAGLGRPRRGRGGWGAGAGHRPGRARTAPGHVPRAVHQ